MGTRVHRHAHMHILYSRILWPRVGCAGRNEPDGPQDTAVRTYVRTRSPQARVSSPPPPRPPTQFFQGGLKHVVFLGTSSKVHMNPLTCTVRRRWRREYVTRMTAHHHETFDVHVTPLTCTRRRRGRRRSFIEGYFTQVYYAPSYGGPPSGRRAFPGGGRRSHERVRPASGGGGE